MLPFLKGKSNKTGLKQATKTPHAYLVLKAGDTDEQQV